MSELDEKLADTLPLITLTIDGGEAIVYANGHQLFKTSQHTAITLSGVPMPAETIAALTALIQAEVIKGRLQGEFQLAMAAKVFGFGEVKSWGAKQVIRLTEEFEKLQASQRDGEEK